MLAKTFAAVLLAFGVFGVANSVLAQDSQGTPKEKTFVDRLDDFGRTIFGGVLPAEKSKAKSEPRRKPAAMASSDDVDMPPTNGKRAGSILAGPAAGQSATAGGRSAGDGTDFMPENTPSAVPRTADGMPKAVRRPLTGASLVDDKDVAEKSMPQSLAAPPRRVASGKPAAISDPLDASIADKPASRPLHERLSTFRQSAFGSDPAGNPHTETGVASSNNEASSMSPPRAESLPSQPTQRPIIAQRSVPDVSVGETISAVPKLQSPSESLKPSEQTSPAIQDIPVVAKTDGNDGILITRKGPVLSVETVGPRRISVGKESAYEVGIVNSGEVAAEDLVIFISLPEWAEVAGTDASSGAAQADTTGPTAGTVRWKLGHLDAKGRDRLKLRIIPRQSRPFDLAVRWEYKPVASQAMIEVQEPKLALQLEGPREVLYGKKEVYRLKLINVGTGAAENVAIMLMPIGGGENVPATHKIGLLAAGEERVLDVELTARQTGGLTIQVDARADGGVHAELAEKVAVRRAGLKIDVEGPKMQFVGVPITYAIRVRNPGTAPARNVNISITLPAGAKYLTGIETARLDDSGRKLEWTVESINPEVEQSFALKCSLGAAGASRIQVLATADDDLTSSAGAVTQVESVANLVMQVRDPEGPVAVGEEATYEILVRNRGTKDAESVEVFGYFSRGIEPTGAEGAPNRLGPGQVIFQAIPSLAPGAEAIFKVRAKADAAGNHIFRAEAHCKPLGARLIREATNLYYLDTPTAQQAASEPVAESPGPAPMRTVNRPAQGEQTPAPPRK